MQHNFAIKSRVMKKYIFTLAAIHLIISAFGQNHDSAEKSFPHFRIAGLIGHTFIPTSVSAQARMVIPSWGLDVEYWFNERIAIGLHNDIEIQSFLIEKDGDEVLEREFPLVLTLDALYKLPNGLVFGLGPGYEIEPNESFFLIRAGVEYEIELHHHWDLSPTVFYDTRFEANDTWTFAIGIGKRF